MNKNNINAKNTMIELIRNVILKPSNCESIPVPIIPIPMPKSNAVKKVELAAPLLVGVTRLLIIA